MNDSIKNISRAFIMVFMLLHCGLGPVTDSGGASETIAIIVTDTGIFGKVTAKTEEGDSAVQGVMVKIFNDNYLPFFKNTVNNFYDSTISTVNGDFRFFNINNGAYKIYAQNALSGRSAFIDSIIVCDSINDTMYGSLTIPGTISGHVYSILTTNDTLDAAFYNVFIFGLQFKTKTNASGSFLLNGLPEGYYSLFSAPDSIFSTSDSLSNSFAVQYVKTINKLNAIDTVQSGKTLAGKKIYLIR